jgi:hypothetical protein
VRENSVPRKLLGTCVLTVIVVEREMHEGEDGGRSKLEVWVRRRAWHRGRSGRCGGVAPCFDDGRGERRCRHVDIGIATCELGA